MKWIICSEYRDLLYKALRSRSSSSVFAYPYNKGIVFGVLYIEGCSIVEMVKNEEWVVASIGTKQFLRASGVDVKEVKHNEIVDLSVNGDRWEGDVLNGKPYGWGVLFDKNNERVYEGFRIDEKNVCYGRTYYSNVLRVEYEGEWCDGLRWGRGVLFDRNGGVVYDGGWLNDDRLEKRVNITSASVLLHNHVEELRVSDGCCNGRDLTELDLSGFVSLRELKVGNNCFDSVDEVRLMGLSEFESVVIGESSFTKYKNWYGTDPNRHFYLKNCPKLKSLKMGRYSFSDYTVIEIENVDALEVIEMGDLNEDSDNFYYASLELKSILIHSK